MKSVAVLCILVVIPCVFGHGKYDERKDILNLLRRLKNRAYQQPHARLANENITATTALPDVATTALPDVAASALPDAATTTLPDGSNVPTEPPPSNYTNTINGTYGGPDFTCDNGEMTYSAYVCDGDNDCGDCTDEPADLCDTPCVPGQWTHDEFTCVNDASVTVPASWLCDGDNDCGDCSDEAGDGCDTACDPEHYNFPDFTCNNGEVTYSDYVCDGDNDCGDCSDEPADLCDTPCVPGQFTQEFTCDNGDSVPSSWLCDGDNDCGDCSDESGANCEEECDADSTYVYNEDADFTCDNGAMTYSSYVCDGDNDCGDCTDEPADLCDTPCVAGQWNHDDLLCDNGNGPFPQSYACDGWNDCGDCSDEVCDQHRAACEGTEEGENFAGRGGYLRKRANLVKTKEHGLQEKRRMRILAEKRGSMQLVKTRASIAEKKAYKEPSIHQKRTTKRTSTAVSSITFEVVSKFPGGSLATVEDIRSSGQTEAVLAQMNRVCGRWCIARLADGRIHGSGYSASRRFEDIEPGHEEGEGIIKHLSTTGSITFEVVPRYGGGPLATRNDITSSGQLESILRKMDRACGRWCIARLADGRIHGSGYSASRRIEDIEPGHVEGNAIIKHIN